MPDNDFNRSTELSDDEETNQEPPLSNIASQESQQYASDQDARHVYDAFESISSDKLVDVVKGEAPYKCIRECLAEFFDDESLRDFCHDYFNAVFKKLHHRDGFAAIIRNITSHCDQHGEMERLWESIKIVRPSRYSECDVYYRRWKEAVKRNLNERINTNEYAYTKQDIDSNTTHGSGNSPLDQKGEEFTQWFFGELKKNEQSLLLTAALFEGLSRRKMIDVAKTLEDILSK